MQKQKYLQLEKFKENFSLKESFLIYNAGHGGGGEKLNPLKILSPQPEVRVRDVLSNKRAANEHIDEMQHASSLEMQKPLKEISDGVSGAVKKVLSLPGAIWKGANPGALWKGAKSLVGDATSLITRPIAGTGSLATTAVTETGKLGTKIIGGGLGWLVNLPRRIWDTTISFAGKIPTILGDKGGKLLGLPSRMLRSGTEKMVKKIESTGETIKKIGRDIHDRAMSVIGLGEHGGGHGGHGGHALAAAH